VSIALQEAETIPMENAETFSANAATRRDISEPRTPAQRGAALLDLVCPSWPARIDLRRLEMRQPGDCVLGQLYGTVGSYGYLYGLIDLGLSVGDGRFSHGFAVPRSITYSLYDMLNKYDQLTDEWRELIEDRLEARVA
jgi:hypothetical protein